jgi:hypothetical protein
VAQASPGIVRYAGPGITTVIGVGLQLSGITIPILGIGLMATGVLWGAAALIIHRHREKKAPASPAPKQPIDLKKFDELREMTAPLPLDVRIEASDPFPNRDDHVIVTATLVNQGATAEFVARTRRGMKEIGQPLRGEDYGNFPLRWENETAKACRVQGGGGEHRIEIAEWNYRRFEFRFLGPNSSYNRDARGLTWWHEFSPTGDIEFQLDIIDTTHDQVRTFEVVIPVDFDANMVRRPIVVELNRPAETSHRDSRGA